MKKIYFVAATFLFLNTFNSQVYYTEDFESGNGANWKYTDLDGDGKNFSIVNVSKDHPGLGTKSLVSYSWYNTPLTPDNLVSSTPITLPSGVNNIFLKYNVDSQPDSDGAEHYAVYVSNTDDPTTITNSTPVLEETLPMAGRLLQKTIDLSAYAGQTIYLSFRHFNCVNMFTLILDNLSIQTLQNNDAKLLAANVPKYIATNTQTPISYTIINQGANNITSVELNWNDGTDHKATVNTNIQPGQTVVLNHPTKLNYSDVNYKNITATISLVNGSQDPNTNDNYVTTSTTVASQIVPKKVVFEEGTGTWCQWCPRGMVALKKVNEDYPNDQISIAIHTGSSSEPMRDTTYSNGAGFSSFPGMNVDRELLGKDIDPGVIGSYVVQRKNTPTPVLLGGEYTIDGSTLTVNTNATFYANFPTANFRLAAVVIEDGVKGTGPGYNQANAYAGGKNGVMGGFESLPSNVPASQMVYDHVGRAILGGYKGQADSVPTTLSDQQVVNYTFTYTIPAKYNSTSNVSNDVIPNPNNMHIALLLIDQNDNTIVNAAKLTKKDLAVNDISKFAKNTVIYPNPATSDFNIKTQDGNYNVIIFDMAGREVKNYGKVNVTNGLVNLPVKLTSGKYLINISQNGESVTKDLIVK